MFVLKSE